jgi:hypothetical protein
VAINNALAGLPNAFSTFCASRGIVYEDVVRRDMLASVLASQLVLMAGPSGTGKSTGARVLAEFFTDPAALRPFDVRPLWTGPEGLVGYYSALATAYEEADGLAPLLDLHASPQQRVPFAILEEANLSPTEVYLGGVLTQLSGLTAAKVEWQLHRQAGLTAPPPKVTLEPYPRFVATINVDSTAAAPSPKVCGRALTVLLEAPDVTLAISSTSAIGTTPPTPSTPGAAVIGDPQAAWFAVLAASASATLTGALSTLCGTLEADLKANYVTPRDVQRSVLFMAWYVALAEHDTGFTTLADAAVEAAELAILHVVLPGLGSGQFGSAVQSLKKVATVGGLLDLRLDRVLASTKGIYGAPPDFWAALS